MNLWKEPIITDGDYDVVVVCYIRSGSLRYYFLVRWHGSVTLSLDDDFCLSLVDRELKDLLQLPVTQELANTIKDRLTIAVEDLAKKKQLCLLVNKFARPCCHR